MSGSDRYVVDLAGRFTRRRVGIGPLRGFGRLAEIDAFAKFLAGFKEWHRFFIHGNGFAGARIATGARVPVLGGEGAEAAQFHPFAPRQRLGDLIENRANDRLDVRCAQMWIIGG